MPLGTKLVKCLQIELFQIPEPPGAAELFELRKEQPVLVNCRFVELPCLGVGQKPLTCLLNSDGLPCGLRIQFLGFPIADKILCLLPIRSAERFPNLLPGDKAVNPDRAPAATILPAFVATWAIFPMSAIGGKHGLEFYTFERRRCTRSATDSGMRSVVYRRLPRFIPLSPSTRTPVSFSKSLRIVSGLRFHRSASSPTV